MALRIWLRFLRFGVLGFCPPRQQCNVIFIILGPVFVKLTCNEIFVAFSLLNVFLEGFDRLRLLL